MKRKTCFVPLLLTLGLCIASGAWASMSSDNFSIPSSTLSGGGLPMASVVYQANGTLGQACPPMDAGDPPFSVNYGLCPGFWHTSGAAPLPLFALLSPSYGASLSAPPRFEWSSGGYDVFGLYLFLPIYGSYYPIPNPPPIWWQETSFDLAITDPLWSYVDAETWAIWVVLGVNQDTGDWEVGGPWYFRKSGTATD